MSNKYVENSGEKPTHGMNKDEEMKRKPMSIFLTVKSKPVTIYAGISKLYCTIYVSTS